MAHPLPRLTWLAIVALACADDRAPARIGFVFGELATGAGAVAQAALDSLARPGERPVRLITPPASMTGPGAASPSGPVHLANAMAILPDISGIVGPPSSREALHAAPIYAEARIPAVIPTATSRRVRDAGRWIFTLAPDDSVEGEFLAAFVHDRLHAPAVTLYSVPDEYGLGLRDATAAALERRGVAVADRVTLPLLSVCGGPLDPVEAVVTASLQRTRPAVAVFASRTPETACAIRLLAARHPGMRFVAGDGTVASPDLFDIAGAAVDSLYLVAFWHPDVEPVTSTAFVQRFRRVANRMPHHADALVYDAAMVLGTAIRAAGADGESVRDYLASLGVERPAYQGLTGAIAFGAAAHRPIFMTRASTAARGAVLVR